MPPSPSERLADALRGAADEVEESHGAHRRGRRRRRRRRSTQRLEALVAASREALTNAAKFAADGGPVRLYAEIDDGAARVCVDDRGPGFDPERSPPTAAGCESR